MSKQSDLVSVSQGSGGDPLYIDTTNDRVGVGTTSPVDTFHAVGSDGATSRTTYQGATEFIFENNGDFSIDLSTGNANQAFINWHDTDAVQQGWLSYNHNGDHMRFGVNAAERMRIDSSGNVGIGTSSPTGELTIYKSSGSVALDITRGSNRWTIGEYDNNNLLQIGGLYGSHPGIYMNSSGAALVGDNAEQLGNGVKMLCCSGHGYASLRVRRSADSGPCVAFYGYGSNSTLVGRIDVNNTSTSYITSSDYRLKENVTPLDGAADRLAQIPVHRFNFIADPDTTVDGFLAHEVQAFVPEAITGEKDGLDADGNPEYQGIDQSKLVPLLTAALQEALQKIDALEARVAALEAV